MATNELYIKAADLSNALNMADALDESVLLSVIEAVSRSIDEHCGRHFYYATETRYYTADDATLLRVDDLLSVTTLKTDADNDRTYERTWSTSDYDLLPFNASTDGKPYTRIAVSTASGSNNYAFPTHPKGVEITGSFGYKISIPHEIQRACLLKCERLFRRHDAIFGVMGSIETGMIRITDADPDVIDLLRPFVKTGVLAV